MPLGRDEGAASALLVSLFLLGSAGVLAGGFYFASKLSTQQDEVPDVGVWGDDADDRLVVVQGDEDSDWAGLEVRTDRPARVRLDGQASVSEGVLSPGSGFVRLSDAGLTVSGGDALSLCAMNEAGPLKVTLRDASSHIVLFDQTLTVARCERGNGPAEAAEGQDGAKGGNGKAEEALGPELDVGNDAAPGKGRDKRPS